MIAILTGDISNSRGGETKQWLKQIKTALSRFGKTPNDWELFRGDSFQLKVDADQALLAAIYIKACMKELKDLDVRIAIGIGEEQFESKRISESNGTAYIRSGEAFEGIKKQKLTYNSGDENQNLLWNTMFDLAMLSANNWTPIVAKVIRISIENPEKKQSDIVKLIGKSQSTISEALKRGGYDEIMRMNQLFEQKIQ